MKILKWSVVLLIVIYSCKKEREYEYPLVYTGDVTNINNNGANFNAKIVDLGKINITEYGFVWDSVPDPTIADAEKYVIQEAPTTGVFSANISTTLREGKSYYVRAFVRSSDYISYGMQVLFTSMGSLAPKITDFMPKTGNLKDTLMILGHNFSYKPTKNIVKFGNFQSTVLKASQDTLWVTVSALLNTPATPITVSILGNVATSTDMFNLIPPVINYFNAKVASIGSQVTIFGKNFTSNPSSLNVYFDKYLAKIVEVHENNIIVIVPDSLDKRQSNIKVKMNNLNVISSEPFNLSAMSINDFTPKIAVTGSTIILTGNSFSPIIKNNSVSIGGYNAVVTKASVNRLEVTLPLQNVGFYPSRNVKINVSVLGENKDFMDLLLINDKWFRLHDLPFTAGYNGCGVISVLNGKAYINVDNRVDFWEYNPTTEKWTRLADFFGPPRLYGAGFGKDGKIYYGTGYGTNTYNDWWEYTIAENKWRSKNDFSGNAVGEPAAVSFQIGNDVYFAMGNYWNSNNFWKYSTADDTWTRIESLPITYWHWNFTFAFVKNDIAYMGVDADENRERGTYDQGFYKFNPIDNSWQKLTDCLSSVNGSNPMLFMLGGVIYLRSYTQDFYKYDEVTDKWISVNTVKLPNAYISKAFCIGEKAYTLASGAKDMWEFDPSR